LACSYPDAWTLSGLVQSLWFGLIVKGLGDSPSALSLAGAIVDTTHHWTASRRTERVTTMAGLETRIEHTDAKLKVG